MKKHSASVSAGMSSATITDEQNGARKGTSVEDQISRYARRYHRRLWKMVDGSSRAADLLFSCPATCVAIVTKRGSPAMRAQVLLDVESGLPLDVVRRNLEIPKWLHTLPPEAFGGPFPESPEYDSDDTAFGRCIVNVVPASNRSTRKWLRCVFEARAACDDEFALWIASKPVSLGRSLALKHLGLLGAYAWYSRHGEFDASDLIGRVWSEKMGFYRAARESYAWLLRILLDICIDHQARNGIWSQQRLVNGIEFVPLLTTDALIQEGHCMRNCIAAYAEPVLRGSCHLYSLRIKGARIADMEVRLCGCAPREWKITHLLAPGNKHPTIDVAETAAQWLKAQRADDRPADRAQKSLPIDEAFWAMMWEPYWLAKGTRGILTPNPTAMSVEAHMNALRSFGRSRSCR